MSKVNKLSGQRFSILILSVVSLLVNTGFGIIFPIFPKVLGKFGYGAIELGILAAVFGVTSCTFLR